MGVGFCSTKPPGQIAAVSVFKVIVVTVGNSGFELVVDVVSETGLNSRAVSRVWIDWT